MSKFYKDAAVKNLVYQVTSGGDVLTGAYWQGWRKSTYEVGDIPLQEHAGHIVAIEEAEVACTMVPPWLRQAVAV